MLQPALQLLILKQLEWVLDTELKQLNREHFLNRVRNANMREVRELAAGMKDAVASLRKSHVDLKGELESEITRANINASKVKSVVTDLRDANKEVEDFLGETGSNFPTSEASSTPQPGGHPKALANGVTLNQEASK